RSAKAALSEISLTLGIPVSDPENLENTEHLEAVFKFLATRSSSELLRNRLSDLCGLISFCWSWLGGLLELGVLIAVIWYTVTEDRSCSLMAWSIIAIAIFFWITHLMFTAICKVLTGRTPGQASRARKSLAKHANERRAAVNAS